MPEHAPRLLTRGFLPALSDRFQLWRNASSPNEAARCLRQLRDGWYSTVAVS